MSIGAMTTPLLDAFELVAHSEQLLPRLDAAVAELGKRPGLAEEKAWLKAARARMAAARDGVSEDLPTRALRLPELEPLKGDYTRVLQGAVVDALEHLHAGITFAGGNRAPLLEALYYKLKIPALRRCDRDDFEAFCSDFEKRLTSSYARRMLADETYAPVAPALERLRRSVAVWRSIFIADPIDGAAAQALREELETAARRLELPCRQSRLLAQAALVPLKDVAEAPALVIPKPKRRVARLSGLEGDDDTHPVLEQDPPDPAEPTPEERAELEAAQSS
jgi:hypothetical protein